MAWWSVPVAQDTQTRAIVVVVISTIALCILEWGMAAAERPPRRQGRRDAATQHRGDPPPGVQLSLGACAV